MPPRVYNSAFMNMLKKEENQKYRDTVKNTIKFEPAQILKSAFVNFHEPTLTKRPPLHSLAKETNTLAAATTHGDYAGLPMFGHGQLEGFEEKYGHGIYPCIPR